MKNLLLRSLSGIIYVVLIVAGISTPWSFLVLMVLLAALASAEFYRLCPRNESRGSRVMYTLDVLLTVLLVVEVWISAFDGVFFVPGSYLGLTFLCLYIAGLMIRFFAQLNSRDHEPMASLGYSMLGQIYIGFPLAAVVALYSLVSPWAVLTMFVLLWLNDTGAYIVGCNFGRHRLCERLSPKKSWEGFWGGMIFSVIGAVVISLLWRGSFPNWIVMACWGVIVGVIGTLGDLVESMFKRSVSLKDSGHIIPGHGGILDRIDSLLAVAPASLLLFLCIMYS